MPPPRDTWSAIRADGDQARRVAESGRLRRALARARWSLARAALALEVDVDTLRRHIERRHPDLCAERRRMLARMR